MTAPSQYVQNSANGGYQGFLLPAYSSSNVNCPITEEVVVDYKYTSYYPPEYEIT